MSSWEDQLWAEMNSKSDPDKIVMASDLITHLMRDLLPELANVRRMTIVHLIESGEFSTTSLAESIGARPGTITRLVEEGRKLRRIGEAA